MPWKFQTKRRVEFAETDMAGLAHFSNFFRWMEEAEHAFFRSLGFSIEEERDGKKVGWPRLSAACNYSRPARFEDEIDIHLEVVKLGTKTLTCQYQFQIGEEEIASGEMVTICCQCSPGEPLKGIPIPEEVRKAIDKT